MNSGRSAPLPRLSPTPRITTTLTSLSTVAARNRSAYRSRAIEVGAFRILGTVERDRGDLGLRILLVEDDLFGRWSTSRPICLVRHRILLQLIPAAACAGDGLAVSTSAPVSVIEHGIAAEHRTDACFPHVGRDGQHRARIQALAGRRLRQVGRDHRRIEPETETVRHRHRGQRFTGRFVGGEQVAGRRPGLTRGNQPVPQLIRAPVQARRRPSHRRPARCVPPRRRSRRPARRTRRPPDRPRRSCGRACPPARIVRATLSMRRPGSPTC